MGEVEARLRRRAARAKFVLLLESLVAAFWPLPVLVIFFLSVAFFDLLPHLPGWLHVLTLGGFLAAAAFFAWRGLHIWRLPSADAARRRIERDNDLSHRPLTGLEDPLAAGQGDRLSESLWHQHRTATLARLGNLRVAPPWPQLARLDRFALRGLAMLLLATSLGFGYADWPERLARAFEPRFVALDKTKLALDAWISPPAYSRLPPIFLAAEQEGPIEILTGSRFLAQIQGAESAQLLIDEQAVAFEPFADAATKIDQVLSGGTQLRVEAKGQTLGSWPIRLIADSPPQAAFNAPPRKSERLSLRVDFAVSDDFGVDGLTARIERIAGPEGETPLELEIFLPHNAAEEQVGSSFHDLTAHPWAGLAVAVQLIARDALGQEGLSSSARIVLPERFFEHPVARAIIELRKQLTVDPDRRSGVAESLNAIASLPQHYRDDTVVALALFVTSRRLSHETGPAAIGEAQEILWETALRIEEGELGIAERDLRSIQEALMEALARGANDAEIERLLDELQQALDRFLEALAEQMLSQMEQGRPPPPNMAPDGRLVDRQDLKDLIDQARKLAQSGAREAALEMLNQLQNILENLRANPMAEGMDGEYNDAHRMMTQMEDMLSEQQELLDRSFRRSERTRPGEGGDPKAAQDSQMDALTQEALREQLGEMMRQLGEMLGDMPQALGRAEQEMRSARDALQRNEPGQAVHPQSRSLDQLQQGMQAMAESFLQMFDNLQERGSGNLANRPGTGSGPDPLGRREGTGSREATQGVEIPNEGELRRSRRILDELRRRRGEHLRPPLELDYIDRLLRQF
jgi:uncharacterized protein (TIGR02302 family)